MVNEDKDLNVIQIIIILKIKTTIIAVQALRMTSQYL